MSALDTEPFPRGALIGAAILLSLSVGLTAVARMEKLAGPQIAPEAFRAAPRAFIDLRFQDRPDGSVGVFDAAASREIGVLAPGQDGFVRGVMRGLARERLKRRIGPDKPFRLAELSGGRLFLTDAATGRVIDLQAFGKDNRRAFERFLPSEGIRS